MAPLGALLVVLILAVSAPRAIGAQSFDHSSFDRLLAAHVSDGLVDYEAFDASPEFEGYLASLAAFDPAGLERDARLAFWINAYNAYTLALINKHEERKSIRNINKTLGFIKGYGPWKERLAVVGDSAYGLDEIEQEIIRPEFQEPRIHFALVCAAMGCPPLREEAYVGERLNEQLDDQARTFLLASPDKNRIDLQERTAYLSELFKFRDYAKDFGGSDEAIGRYVARFYPEGPERALLESGEFKLRYTKYDWALNSQELGRVGGAS